jgi:hypothetical protein
MMSFVAVSLLLVIESFSLQAQIQTTDLSRDYQRGRLAEVVHKTNLF